MIRKNLRTSGFSLVELLVVMVIIGLLSMVAIPTFIKYIRRARVGEATLNMRRIHDGVVTFYNTERSDVFGNYIPRQFPAGVGYTPVWNSCCPQSGNKCAPNLALWNDPTWLQVNFALDEPHYFMYAALRSVGDGTGIGNSFSVQATADLNCNGVGSFFQRLATINAERHIIASGGLFSINEVE